MRRLQLRVPDQRDAGIVDVAVLDQQTLDRSAGVPAHELPGELGAFGRDLRRQADHPAAERVPRRQARGRRPGADAILADDLRFGRIGEKRFAPEPGEGHRRLALGKAPRLVVPGDVEIVGRGVLHHLLDPFRGSDRLVGVERRHPVALLPTGKRRLVERGERMDHGLARGRAPPALPEKAVDALVRVVQRFRRGQQIVGVLGWLQTRRLQQIGAPPGQLGVRLHRDPIALAVPNGSFPIRLRNVVDFEQILVALDEVVERPQRVGTDHLAQPGELPAVDVERWIGAWRVEQDLLMHRVEVDHLHRDRAAGHVVELADDPLGGLCERIADEQRLNFGAAEHTLAGRPGRTGERRRGGPGRGEGEARLQQFPTPQADIEPTVLAHVQLLLPARKCGPASDERPDRTRGALGNCLSECG